MKRAAERSAEKIRAWLEHELEEMDYTAEQRDDDGPLFNLGGQMIFLPEHQGSGFTGEFTEDFWMVPMFINGTDETAPHVMNALVMAFIAGARWQKRKMAR